MIAQKDLLIKAGEMGYAVPAFNYSDIWDLKAIIEAAEEERAIIMVSANPLVIEAFGVELNAAMGKAVMEKASVPVLLHLDHSFSEEMCYAAIDAGFPSVMMDASKYPLEENIKIVNRVVDYAHKRGVIVEAELGRIRGKGIEGDFTGDDFLVDPAECVTLVKESGADSLAIGIGNAHGFYKGKPELNFKRLEEVNNAVDVPLVLHGGTGIPEEDIRKAILGGINKINVGTIIHCTYMNNLKAELNRLPENPYTLDVMKPVREKIKEVVKGWIRSCLCTNRA
ncbi:fructose-bisphosphate aldolase [Spirochaetia bacterium]|nr:fructose-bisphosphate aldolase [Spirochaetia bacterium]